MANVYKSKQEFYLKLKKNPVQKEIMELVEKFKDWTIGENTKL